ncbi:MAG: pyridoxine 5'-phosphate synthase [Saprospiraceae bacterium]|nr:pyridoxine 5'-phosphate synthase [Saprospiraceae bacterium]MBK6477209.1 pyridoxine 5'-phosphate synthase [Saprospiraceae bacterium]MBK6814491.1 pyridoxine 5'-phosphate synthase [Saprospiraceae bacterium]MBK7369878.1 pyridoxine 5'-phosphate synthase [Saprospiraceae bacterium]MBK7437582.1 pyridoxine 5'-phosphate synthase [Saprospiraceae bacterium]
MTRLSVNLNKVALIRNSRGGNMPDLVQVAVDCEKFGAEGITIHPRPDQRHARYSDVQDLRKVVQTELNIEGYPTDKFIDVVIKSKPDQVTLVPDEPGALTSDHGWDTVKKKEFLTDIVKKLRSHGIRTSLFIDPDPKWVEGAALIGADRVELYTGPYAYHYKSDPAAAIKSFHLTSLTARSLGIGLNAGHDLNLDNLYYFQSVIVDLLEVSIGHAMICDALYMGLEKTIHAYLEKLKK